MPSNSVPISTQGSQRLLAELGLVRHLCLDTFTKSYLRSTVSPYALRQDERPSVSRNSPALRPRPYTSSWNSQIQETKPLLSIAATTTMPKIFSSPMSQSDATLSRLTNRLLLSTSHLWWDQSCMDTLSQHFKRNEESSGSLETTTSFYPSKRAIRHSELYFRSFRA